MSTAIYSDARKHLQVALENAKKERDAALVSLREAEEYAKAAVAAYESVARAYEVLTQSGDEPMPSDSMREPPDSFQPRAFAYRAEGHRG